MAVPWGPGTATGVGSLPGTDAPEAARLVVGELPDLPHVPELPDRGAGAGITGRGLLLLTDLWADLQPSGWRIVPRPGVDHRRARDLLARDLDAVEEAAHDHDGLFKAQLAGPWTLSGTTELTLGDKVLSDHGACHDVAEALADGVRIHITDLRRRLPHVTDLLVQVDEPLLPTVRDGRLRSASGYGVLRQPDRAELLDGLRTVLGAIAEAGAVPGVHCCTPLAPIAFFREAGAQWVSVDLTIEQDEEQLGSAIEAGVGLVAGTVPSSGSSTTSSGPLASSGRPSDPRRSVEPVRMLWKRLGLTPDSLAHVAVSPTCGLAGATPAEARAALKTARDTAAELAS
ncbi:MAG TPA: methionine synthase [Mycobacteriales bacterium]|nr:methionine synthase [Mycobacteriales bacterium]